MEVEDTNNESAEEFTSNGEENKENSIQITRGTELETKQKVNYSFISKAPQDSKEDSSSCADGGPMHVDESQLLKFRNNFFEVKLYFT